MILHSDYPFPVRRSFLEDEIEIAYMDIGKGAQTLVFVHGFANYAPIWEKNMEVLQKYYRCLALDLPGHGLSSQGDYPYSMSFYGQVIRHWLQQQGIEKPVLIGHSMGGQIAAKLVIDFPGLFSHLILVAPAGFETFDARERFVLNQLIPSGIIHTSQYLRVVLNLRNYFHELEEEEYRKMKEFSRDFYSLKNNPGLHRVLSRSIEGMTSEPVFQNLHRIGLPTLVFFGREDRLIPNRLLHPHESPERIALRGCNQIADCELKLYDHTGHFLQYEQAARFTMDLYKFLNPLVFRKTL